MSTPSEVRTRFAPSPTGYLHIGGARTALYCYLLAKRHSGKFILRIEDTDLERSTPEAIQAILDGMSWLGLNWDEGPYYQTKRFGIYNEHVDKLITEGKAYPCFCSTAELAVKREMAEAAKVKYRYDRTCHKLSAEERANKIAAGVPHCIRFYSTDEGAIEIDDKIKGKVVVDAKELDDLIIRRTDGSPTYNFCVVVDDALMGITHVVRGDDHLNNTPRQIQLYRALGFPLPIFAHCSMIMGPDKKKLSKRHGATSVIVYKDLGYLPHALLNYLVRLGWSHKDQEIFSMEEMISLFNLEAVSPSNAIFDLVKLQWLNGHYIRESKPEDLLPEVHRFLEQKGATNIDEKKLLRAVDISREKVKTLVEMADFIDFLFLDTPADESAVAKAITEPVKPTLKHFSEELVKSPSTTHDDVHRCFEVVMAEFSIGLGKIANPVRVALSGRGVSPGAYDLIDLFGKDESLKRLKRYL
jgi:glutamyl-tRNA synthetase